MQRIHSITSGIFNYTACLILLVFLGACQSKKTSDKTTIAENQLLDTAQVAPSFFPVSNFILGQLQEIKKAGLPLNKTVTREKNTESKTATIQELMDSLSVLVKHPIDSAQLAHAFVERKFDDQSIGSITMSYERSKLAADSIPWKNWDVYLDPESGSVKRIYLVEQQGWWTRRLITWIPGSSCKLVIIREKPDCLKPDIHEVTFRWGN